MTHHKLTVDALNDLLAQMEAHAEAIAAMHASQERMIAELVELNERMAHGVKVQTVLAL